MKKMGLLFFVCISTIFAQDIPPQCKNDFKKLCSEEMSRKDFMVCLRKNHKELSLSCRQTIEREIKEEIKTKPPTGMLFSGSGGLGGQLGFIPLIRYTGEQSGPLSRRDKREENQIRRHSIEGSLPLTKLYKGLLSTSLRYGQTRFDQDVTLNSGAPVDQDLYQFEFGLNYNRPLKGKKNFNLRANYGYRGDRIGGSDYNYSLMTGYSYPTESKKGRWQYFLMFSNNGPLGNNIPIPGFMYFYRTSTMNILVGLPILSFQWTPAETQFGVSAALFGPFYNLELSYGLVDELQYFAFTRWKQENFILSTRTDEEDRLNIYEKVTGLGLRTVLMNRNVGLELRAGVSQDRKLYLGNGLFNNDKGSLDLEDTAFIKVMISKAFR